MKTKLTILLIILCYALAATAAFGQTTRIWDGGDGTGTNLGAATNWSGDTLPATTSGTVGDFATWNNVVAGNLLLTYNGGIVGGYQSSGVNFILTANQVGSVTIVSPVAASANLAGGQFWTNSSTAASLQFGDGSAKVLNIIWRSLEINPPFGPHYLINNSTAPNIICPNVRFQAGGGNPHTLIFGGSGNWVITNSLVTYGSGMGIVKQGSGTLLWAGPSIPAALGTSVIISPVDFEGGTVILKTANLLGTQVITNNGTLLEYAAAQSQILSGAIYGSGALKVSAGSLTLSSGASTFSGNTTLSGGELVVSNTETVGTSGPLGVGGTISFSGGTLGFSVANTYDYSPRFSTAASQAYKFDTGGQNVTFATGLSSSGGTLTKLGSGTLILAATNTYTGPTYVDGGGTLIINGGHAAFSTTAYTNTTLGGVGTLSGAVTLNPGARLAPGASIGSVGTLTINSNLTIGGNVAIEVNKSLSLSNDFVVVSGVLTNTGTGTLTVSNLGPALAVGDKFTLFSKPMQNGAALTVTGAGATWANHLADDGSITVTSVTRPALNFTNLSNSLQFSWDTSFGNYRLQSQTNSINVGLSSNWGDYPGGGTSPVTVPMDATKATVFFRLVSP